MFRSNSFTDENGSKAMTIDDLATISDVLEIGGFHFFL
jgi:hypothetical protein